jgi:hypothetical protein
MFFNFDMCKPVVEDLRELERPVNKSPVSHDVLLLESFL